MKIIDPETDMADLATWCSYHPKKAAAEIERLVTALTWMRNRDNRNGSLPAAYRNEIDAALSRYEQNGD